MVGGGLYWNCVPSGPPILLNNFPCTLFIYLSYVSYFQRSRKTEAKWYHIWDEWGITWRGCGSGCWWLTVFELRIKCPSHSAETCFSPGDFYIVNLSANTILWSQHHNNAWCLVRQMVLLHVYLLPSMGAVRYHFDDFFVAVDWWFLDGGWNSVPIGPPILWKIFHAVVVALLKALFERIMKV